MVNNYRSIPSMVNTTKIKNLLPWTWPCHISNYFTISRATVPGTKWKDKKVWTNGNSGSHVLNHCRQLYLWTKRVPQIGWGCKLHQRLPSRSPHPACNSRKDHNQNLKANSYWMILLPLLMHTRNESTLNPHFVENQSIWVMLCSHLIGQLPHNYVSSCEHMWQWTWKPILCSWGLEVVFERVECRDKWKAECAYWK